MSNTDVAEFTQRAAKLRSEGRLEESILAARHATSLDAEDANGWWQLALSLDELEDAEAARSALVKVTELAPHFAGGWCRLAQVHLDAGHQDDAVSTCERALEADRDHVPSLRLLAVALKDSKTEGAAQRRLDVLRSLWHSDLLDRDELFHLAYLLGEADEPAEAARVYEAYTRQYSGGAAFFNLALAYRRLGRDADAIDALEAAQANGYQDASLTKTAKGVRAKLAFVRERVLRKPQPVLPEEDWYQHYVNPFALLGVEPGDIVENPKALQKARQALLREIELEEGKVAWMPGLVLDKSTAMARLDELNDAEAWDAHRIVFDDKALCGFLSRGNLEHFLLRSDELAEPLAEPVMPHLLDASVLEAVGPAFAAQYNKVLTRAVEQGNLDAVECLLDGRRWVLPSQEERCFDGAKRVLERLRGPLLILANEAERRLVRLDEVTAALGHGSMGALLARLPVEFHETHGAAGGALRAIAIAHFNREHDAEAALAIVRVGKVFAEISPSLAHQYKVDEKALDDILAQERSKEAHLTFGQKSLAITRKGVVYGDQKLAPTDVNGVRWGLVQTAASPDTVRHTIAFEAKRGADIVVSWTTSANLEQQRKHWDALVEAALNFVLDDVLTDFERKLDKWGAIRVGPVEVVRDGVVFEVQGWFRTKQVTVPWRNLNSSLANGSLILRDRTDRKVSAVMPLETTYNAIVLRMVASKNGSASS